MSPPGRTERGRNREIIQGRITAYQHARCNMSTRSFIPWGAMRVFRPSAVSAGAGQVSTAWSWGRP
jgi:hypothetical protein